MNKSVKYIKCLSHSQETARKHEESVDLIVDSIKRNTEHSKVYIIKN